MILEALLETTHGRTQEIKTLEMIREMKDRILDPIQEVTIEMILDDRQNPDHIHQALHQLTTVNGRILSLYFSQLSLLISFASFSCENDSF